jgi:hypothetical protein
VTVSACGRTRTDARTLLEDDDRSGRGRCQQRYLIEQIAERTTRRILARGER